MEKIKFRVWDKKRKIIGIVANIDFSSQILFYIHPTETFGRECERSVMKKHIHEIKLMQYTGLKDKNKKEIYEGDIIRNNWHNINKKFIGCNLIVKFGIHETSLDYYASSAYGWYAEEIGGEKEEHSLHNLPSDGDNDIEIVGNIYENSNLLK